MQSRPAIDARLLLQYSGVFRRNFQFFLTPLSGKPRVFLVAELVQRNQEDMMKVRNLGKKSLEEVEQKLVALGLSLKSSEE